MKIWIVEYSIDYEFQVLGVFSSKEIADKTANKYKELGMELGNYYVKELGLDALSKCLGVIN